MKPHVFVAGLAPSPLTRASDPGLAVYPFVPRFGLSGHLEDGDTVRSVLEKAGGLASFLDALTDAEPFLRELEVRLPRESRREFILDRVSRAFFSAQGRDWSQINAVALRNPRGYLWGRELLALANVKCVLLTQHPLALLAQEKAFAAAGSLSLPVWADGVVSCARLAAAFPGKAVLVRWEDLEDRGADATAQVARVAGLILQEPKGEVAEDDWPPRRAFENDLSPSLLQTVSALGYGWPPQARLIGPAEPSRLRALELSEASREIYLSYFQSRRRKRTDWKAQKSPIIGRIYSGLRRRLGQ